jgi:hypothetical protein
MRVTIYNRKHNDNITFDIDKLNEETRQEILSQVHKRGWEDKDCWSEVEDE